MNNPLLNFFKSKIYVALTLVLFTLLVGVLGYRFVSGYSWLDAIYMTVITITTVGYGEVNPLNDDAKIFTIILILSSVVIVGYAISIITEYILNKNNFENIKQRKMQKAIDKLSNHIIICGFGRNGEQAAKKLKAYNRSFVIVEQDKEIIKRHRKEDLKFIYGNANEDETLQKAGIARANTLISALPDDADNLFVVLSSRQINNKLHIISRASQETSYSKLKLAGANNVILPDRIGGDHMASLVVVPDLIEFVDNLSIVGKENINIEEISIEKLINANQNHTIKDLDLRRKTGCTIIGFKSADGNYIVNPETDIKLILNSKIIVLGRPEQINKLNKEYNIN